jgi:hypothetical protein
MERREYLLNEITELNSDIEEAKKEGYKTDSLEAIKKEYLQELDSLGGYDTGEATKINNQIMIEACNYLSEVYA